VLRGEFGHGRAGHGEQDDVCAEERFRDGDDRPERGIGIYTDYSGVVVPLGESVRMDLTVENKGKQDEVVDLKLASVPKGWKASLKGGSFTVTGVAVPDGKSRTLSFSAEPDKGLSPGTYEFGIEGVTVDGKLKANYAIAVTSRERSRLGTEDIQITTSYPVLRGQTDATFEFSLDVNNKTDADPKNDGTGGWIISTDYASTLGWIEAFGGEVTRPDGKGYRLSIPEANKGGKRS
jgi:uncharacterized membrane protein